MKHLKYIAILFFICLFTLSPAYADDDTYDEDSGVDRQKIYHVYNDVDLVPTVKIVYDRPRIVVRATYPLLTTDNSDNENIDTFNQLVSDLIAEEIKSFKNQAKDLQSAQQNMPKKPGTKNDLTIDFDTSIVNTGDKPIVSIRFNVQGYVTGQAHPSHHHRVLNFDLDSGEEIKLNDLFYPDANYLDFFATYSRDVLDKKLRDKEMIMSGTTPTPENYRNWNINPSGLLITFDEYQVAPYVYGTQTVLIPYSALKNMIAPDSPVAVCVKHQRRCSRNNLLTGGFMDEA